MMKSTIFTFFFLMIFFPGFAQTVNFTSSNLPVIVINTNGQTIVDEPKITADMGIIFNSGNARNNLTDAFNHYNGKIGIEIRGQSSQSFPMKSYSIELRDLLGNSTDKSLFGLPKESDWILYAPFTDKSLMRNVLTYALSREMGHWAANTRFVELIVNGDYKGVYVFMERIKRGSGRVNISKMAATDIAGDAVTGGYIFSLDKGANGWLSAYTIALSPVNEKRRFSYVYPKIENIVSEQSSYLKSYVDSFENALAGSSFQDPAKGFRKFADASSFIDFFLLNETSRSVDAFRFSTYFHKDRNSRNGKIIAGPVWDFDLAFRNADFCNGSFPTGWAHDFNTICPGDQAGGLIPFWWKRFLEDTAYTSNLRCRWKSLRQTTLSVVHFNKLIDSMVTLLGEAQQRHFQRWDILGKYVWPNPQPIAATYVQEIENMKAFISARLLWIDQNIPNKGACYDYPADTKESIIVLIAPNPVITNGNIQISSRINQQVQMQVIDMMGRQLGSRKINVLVGINNIALNSRSWSSGIYYVNFISSTGDKISRKIIK